MPTYTAQIPCVIFVCIEVDAADEEEATERALDLAEREVYTAAGGGIASGDPRVQVVWPGLQLHREQIDVVLSTEQNRCGCGWSGPDSDLEHHLHESLCPQCRSVVVVR